MNVRSVFLLMLSVPAVAGAPSGTRQYLDTETVATITVAMEPSVFARERPDLAVNARDYLSLAPLEVDKAGQRQYYWCAYIWSTIDRHDAQPWLSNGDQIVLVADARPIPLHVATRSPREIGIANDPLRRPGRHAVLRLLMADLETIGYAARADELHIELISDGTAERIAPWRHRRSALRAFADGMAALAP